MLTREALAGIVTTLALVPDVISFSVVVGVDPIVNLVSSVVLVITMSILGGRVIQIAFGAAGLARLMRFIPCSVIIGFVNALGILIFVAQVRT